MVQVSKVAEIYAAWVASGRPRCSHERIDKEYDLGGDTGDWACLDCGQTWFRGEGRKPATDELDE